MLKLKRVEIQGFKSFYDRTEMKFNGSGIAAVVGPNGCGKSNLSDAISWVLGEQSAKSLRGARMEDVIFAGTRDKKPLSMASVTITMIPDEAALTPIHLGIPAEAETAGEHAPTPDEGSAATAVNSNGSKRLEVRGEVTITRRLYRSGESEYLINGKAARLRDIQELFLGTGLGPESYAIIEQGRIGQILSNKPQDRRSVIEEAAGITKFKTRKRLAEARLESAKQNLARVFDILEEVTRQVNSLKRQAAKTKRYAELKTEAVSYLRQVLTARFRVLERDSAKLVIELNQASSELQTAQASISDLEQQHGAAGAQLYATEQELTDLRKALADLQLEAERARGQFEHQTQQIQQVEARLTNGGRELEAIEREQQVRAAEAEQQKAQLAEVQRDAAAASAQLSAKAAERQAAQARVSEQERKLEDIRQRVLKALNESATLKNRITQVEAQLGSTDRDTARARNEEQQGLAEVERLHKAKAAISEQLQARQTELISVADQRKEVEQQVQAARTEMTQTRQNVDRLRSEHSRIRARHDSLENIIQHRSYTTETVKKLFSVQKPIGVLADFLEVDPQIEKATEEFLHEELEYVVVEGWPEAERGIELMRGQIGGRATFLVEKAGEAVTAAAPEFAGPQTEPGRLSRLTDSMRLTNGLTDLPFQQLPRIANCFVAVDRAIAQELAPQFPHCWFLTPDGTSYQGHAVSGGKKSGAGPLALKRELKEVTDLDKQKERELNSAQSALAGLEKRIQSLTQQLDALRSRQQAQEKDVLALDHESRKLAEETQRVQTRLSNARLELDRIARDRVRFEENVQRDRAALQQSEARRSEEESSLETARGEIGDLQTAVARAAEEHATVRASLASLEERQRSVSSHLSRVENQLRDLANRAANLRRDGEHLHAERARLQTSNTELQARRSELERAISEKVEAVQKQVELEVELRSKVAGLDEQLKGLRAGFNAHQENRSQLQVALTRAESDLKHLDARSEKDLGAALAELAREVETVPDDETLAAIEARYTETSRKIEALGPVNAQALEEYEEAQQRQDFLQVQRQDLLDSIRDTEKAIHEIDGESRKRFLDAFRAINANFREMFQTLFGGGTGEMRLSDEENAAESGIDIVASPPGKRLQSVLLLSGGEKSLTAMALLMAIFQYTPSPFCILDEVDAPLDEPNIERLTRLIREMAEQTQFIVITHSKRTMESAQSLYGVTMQEPGVSKLVSVKFTHDPEPARPPAPKQQEQLEPALV